MTFNKPTCAIPSTVHLKNQAKSQHYNVQLPSIIPPYTSTLIQQRIISTMASRRFTADPAKKKKYINILLQAPNLRVPEAMKLAKFTKNDVADLGLRRFLQRA